MQTAFEYVKSFLVRIRLLSEAESRSLNETCIGEPLTMSDDG